MAVKVHNVRFYNLEPKSINFMACEKNFNLLALSRSDNSIEIWNLSHSPFIERTIVGTCGTVECLAWFGKRLFSASSLQGSVIEYDLLSQAPKGFHPVTSGPCWCIAVQKDKKLLAAGTEEGYINLFDITEDELMYNRILDRQEGRIICLVWDSEGDHIITGSIDTVRVWNVSSGHAIHRMTTGRAVSNTETIVWCLAVTNDFTIISGDSRGKLCFWDGHTGTNIISYQSHKADVRTLCLDQNQQVVYCAGVDPIIVSYEKTKFRGSSNGTKWIKSIQRYIHDHEVRALAVCNEKLYSAGIDGYLALSYPPKVLLKYPPLLLPPSVHTTSNKRLLLFRYPLHLELWKLGSSEEDTPIQLLRWQPPGEFHIKCAQISKNSSWLVCSTLDRFRLYYVNYDQDVPKLKVVHVNSKESLVAHCVSFSSDSKTLAVATINCSIFVISLSNTSINAKVIYTFHPLKNKDMSDSIHQLVLSDDGTYIVSADLNSNIVVWSEGEVYAKLPKYKCAPTAMSVQPVKNVLFVVYADHKIAEYSLESKHFTDFSNNLDNRLPKKWLSRSFCVQNIAFDRTNKNVVLMHDDTAILVMNKSKILINRSSKVPKLENSVDEDSEHFSKTGSLKQMFNVIKKYKHLVFFGMLCEGEVVAVEVSPLSLTEKLPPPYLQKHFGRM